MATTEECRAELLDQLKSDTLSMREVELIQTKLQLLEAHPDIDN